jgi:hypothetical protein
MHRITQIATLSGVAALVVLAVALKPVPALAWWVGGPRIVVGGPPIVVAPRPIFVAPSVVYPLPPVYVAPPRRPAWIPGHWNGPYWVPAHWA